MLTFDAMPVSNLAARSRWHDDTRAPGIRNEGAFVADSQRFETPLHCNLPTKSADEQGEVSDRGRATK